MTHSRQLLRNAGGFALGAIGLVVPASVLADSLVRARIVVDATVPAAVTVQQELQWNAEGGKPRTELAFHLAPGMDVTAVRSEGAALKFRKEDVPGAALKRWVVSLAVPLSPGSSRPLVVETRLVPGGLPGIRADADGGTLLPGSGWFATLLPESDELPPHTTEFKLPAGWTGLACGTRAAGETKWTALPGRPYAVWGAYLATEATAGGKKFSVWSRKGGGEPTDLPRLAALIDAIGAGVGEAPGTGPWKLVDVGRGVVAGGQRTLFWDPAAVAAAKGDAADLAMRDLAGGLAAAHWQEALRFQGSLAAFLAGGMSRYLGDAAATALDNTDDRWRTEAKLVGARRAAFLAARSGDRPLAGLAPQSAEAATILDGRGALVAHVMAEACPSATYWIAFLNSFRAQKLGHVVTGPEFLEALDAMYRNQHTFIKPYLETTDLPDFEIGTHEPSTAGQGDRYLIEVVNRGKADGWAEIAIYDAKDHLIRSARRFVPAGETNSILMGDAARLARIRIDPRGITPQPAVVNEDVKVKPTAGADPAAYVPAFSFSPGEATFRRVDGMDLQLDGVRITGFTGYIQWWETYHGPSGAVLLGKGTVEIAPTGRFQASFRKAMGKDGLSFTAEDLFLRFPLATWEKIRSQMGDPVDDATKSSLSGRRQFVFEHCFPAFFSEGMLAQVPPPGGALVVFGLGGEEWRGFARQPLPNGLVHMRLWDHLRGTTLWEEKL